MPHFSTSLRLLLLAVPLSFALTSCFEDKKKDPQPKEAKQPKGWCGTTTSSGSN